MIIAEIISAFVGGLAVLIGIYIFDDRKETALCRKINALVEENTILQFKVYVLQDTVRALKEFKNESGLDDEKYRVKEGDSI